MRFTILGAEGYIGSHLTAALEARGIEVRAIRRGDVVGDENLGHVVYCVAVTNDASGRPFDTVDANVSIVSGLLRRGGFASFLYLSSVQVYFGAERSYEGAELRVSPWRTDELYRGSKIMGELLCQTDARDTVRVARLSAVCGERPSPRSFLSGVVRDAVTQGHVVLETSLDSARDFVDMSDVTTLLPEIAMRGQRRVYNVASGRNTTNAELISALQKETACTVEVAAGAPRSLYPRVEIDRLRDELGFVPAPHVTTRLGALVQAARRAAANAG